MSDEVALVSIMLANNEIGIIQPMKEISNICKKNNVWLHLMRHRHLEIWM